MNLYSLKYCKFLTFVLLIICKNISTYLYNIYFMSFSRKFNKNQTILFDDFVKFNIFQFL